jgi:CBS domain containing-hemolysin-like protein
MSTIILSVLIIISICLSAMVAGYGTLSTSHLRHWAKQKDAAAKKLYPLKARGSATLLTIELLRALSLSAVFVLLASSMSPWFAWLVIAVLLFVAFIVLTQLFLKPFGIRLLMLLSAPLLGLTNALKPVMLPLGRVFDRFLDEEPVTLTRVELKKMLDAVSPEDTDLSVDELRILGTVLNFSKRTVHDVMIPKSKVITIPVTEALTPVILDDLYKSGHSHFPVLDSDKKTVVGLLSMHDLMDIKHNSAVAEAMRPKVYFVDEDRELDHVLQVFYKTKQTVFVVHNPASDMVGLITIEDVLKEILGKPSTSSPTKVPEAENKESATSGAQAQPVVE